MPGMPAQTVICKERISPEEGDVPLPTRFKWFEGMSLFLSVQLTKSVVWQSSQHPGTVVKISDRVPLDLS